MRLGNLRLDDVRRYFPDVVRVEHDRDWTHAQTIFTLGCGGRITLVENEPHRYYEEWWINQVEDLLTKHRPSCMFCTVTHSVRLAEQSILVEELTAKLGELRGAIEAVVARENKP